MFGPFRSWIVAWARRRADAMLTSEIDVLGQRILDLEREVEQLKSALRVEQAENSMLWKMNERNVAFIDGNTEVLLRLMTEGGGRLTPRKPQL